MVGISENRPSRKDWFEGSSFMSRDNWSVKVAILGALTALSLAALGTGAYFGALSQSNYGTLSNGQAHVASARKINRASQIEERKSGLPDIAERMVTRAEPQSGTELEKRDLAAQETMSVWAFWLLLVSVIGTVAAVAGTFLLVWTLHETRQTSRRQLRAYLSFGSFKLEVFKSRTVPDGARLELTTEIKNGGETPAYDCVHMGNAVVFSEAEAAAYFTSSNEPPRIGRPIPYTVHNGERVSVGIPQSSDLSFEQIEETQSGEKNLYAFGQAIYRDTFGYARKTRFCVVLESKLIPDELEAHGPTITEATWSLAPFHNDAD